MYIKRSEYKWVMLAGVWLAYLSFGIVSGGIPPLISPISTDLELSRSAMGIILGAWPLIYILTSVPAGLLIDRYSVRTTLTIGIGLIALSGMLRAISVDFTTMFIAVMVFGIGGPFISIGAPKIISIWFNESDRGKAMGVYLTAPAIGRIMVLSSSNSILMPLFRYSWRLTLMTFSGIALLSAIVWLFIAKEKPTYTNLNENDKNLFKNLSVFPDLLRIPAIKITLLIILGTFLFNHGTNNWMPEILLDKGFSSSKSGLLSTIPVAMGALSTLILPQFINEKRFIKTLLICFIVASITTLLLTFIDGIFLYPILSLQGVSSRGIMPILMLILINHAGISRTGAAGGLYFTFGEIGGVLGPVLLGVSADILGGFGGGLLSFAVLCAILSVVSLTIKQKKHGHKLI